MSNAAELAREEADRVEAEEAAAAADDATDDATDDAPEEPSSNVSTDKALAAIAKEGDRHAAAVAKIMGDDFALVYPCPTCSEGIAGFTFEAPNNHGGLLPVDEFLTCDKCDGYGQVYTGARDSATWHTTCRKCAGQGYVEVPLPVAQALPVAGPVATNGNQDIANQLRAAGFMVIDPPATPATP